MSSEKALVLTSLVFATFASAIPIILINSFYWVRFERSYRRHSIEKMPPVPLDFRGRWQRALNEPHTDKDVERARLDLRRSYTTFWVPAALMFHDVGIGLPKHNCRQGDLSKACM